MNKKNSKSLMLKVLLVCLSVTVLAIILLFFNNHERVNLKVKSLNNSFELNKITEDKFSEIFTLNEIVEQDGKVDLCLKQVVDDTKFKLKKNMKYYGACLYKEKVKTPVSTGIMNNGWDIEIMGSNYHVDYSISALDFNDYLNLLVVYTYKNDKVDIQKVAHIDISEPASILLNYENLNTYEKLSIKK